VEEAGGVFQETVRVEMVAKEFFDLPPQRGVVAAGFVQVARALRGIGDIERRAEDRTFVHCLLSLPINGEASKEICGFGVRTAPEFWKDCND
jgi:hypothetical protein